MASSYRLMATAMLVALAFVLQISNNVLGLPTGFGMTIDLVAVPVLLALFMFGVAPAIEVLSIATIFIALFSPTGAIGASMKFAATAPTLLVCAVYLYARRRNNENEALWAAAGIAALFAIAVFFAGGAAYAYLSEINGLLFGLLPILVMAAVLYAALRYFDGKKGEGAFAPGAFSDKRAAVALLLSAVLVRGIVTVIANFYFAGPLYFKMDPGQFVAVVNSSDLLFFGKGAVWYVAIFAFNAVQAALEMLLAWLIAYEFHFAKKYSKP